MGKTLDSTVIVVGEHVRLRDDFVLETAEEQDWYLGDLRKCLFCRPNLVTERS
jgi:hypothetical protein